MKPPVARKLAVGHLCVRQLVLWLLVVSSFIFFTNACMVYKHAVVAAFHIYAQRGEDAAKRGGRRPCIGHGNYIVDHGKSWKYHGIVILNFCGNPEDEVEDSFLSCFFCFTGIQVVNLPQQSPPRPTVTSVS